MTKYTDETPITRELLEGAIALELRRAPIDRERIELYVSALADLDADGS